MHMCTCTRTHTYTHKHKRVYIETCTHIHTEIHTHRHTHAHTWGWGCPGTKMKSLWPGINSEGGRRQAWSQSCKSLRWPSLDCFCTCEDPTKIQGEPQRPWVKRQVPRGKGVLRIHVASPCPVSLEQSLTGCPCQNLEAGQVPTPGASTLGTTQYPSISPWWNPRICLPHTGPPDKPLEAEIRL